jgi:hypothetical protein
MASPTRVTRKRIEQYLLKIKCFIPSFKSMHGNLTYLQEGAALLKRLVVGDCKQGTLRGTLKAHWKYSRDCFVETSPGVYQVVRNVSNETAWDLSYKQPWVFVLRHFAELGGRAGMYPYKAGERPNHIRRFLDV